MLKGKKIAIIGASYLQLPLVLAAKELGVFTIAFAWRDGAVCEAEVDKFYDISILEKEQILQICKKEQIDGITTIASDAAIPTVCYVAQSLGLISNSIYSSEISTNKFKMREAFSKGGVQSPLYFLGNDSSNELPNRFQFPVIVKPTDRSGSRGVFKVEKKTDLAQSVQRAQNESFSGQVIVEEFIEGAEVSVEVISWEGKHYLLAITDKVTTGVPYFVELEHHQPSQLSQEIQFKIWEMTQKALNALEIQYGASHSEFKIDASGNVYMIEVGARMGGDFIGSDLVYLSTGYDFLKGVIQVCLGFFEEPQITQPQFSGVFFLAKQTDYLLKYFEQENIPFVRKEINDLPLKNVQGSHERSGYLLYQGHEKLQLNK